MTFTTIKTSINSCVSFQNLLGGFMSTQTTVIAAVALSLLSSVVSAQSVDPHESANELIGTIVFSASPDHTPAGWLPCDGAPYLQRDYPKLFAVIRQHYGSGEPANATFRVPDLKGRVAISNGSTTPELAKPVGTQVGSPTSTVTVTTLGASGASRMHGKLPPGDLEAPDPFDYTNGAHTHQTPVTVSTIQPGVILRCLIKAK